MLARTSFRGAFLFGEGVLFYKMMKKHPDVTVTVIFRYKEGR